MLKRLQLSTTNRPLDVLKHWQQEGYLYLDAPYQRGDVWGKLRRKNLIRSILLGIPIPSLIINDRFAAGWGEEIAVIDGKQRISSILMFLNNELEVPGKWFGLEGEITFDVLPIAQKRRFRGHAIGFSEGKLESLEQEIEVFELINYGGVPQGETDNE